MRTRIRARRVCYPRARGYFVPVAIFRLECYLAASPKCRDPSSLISYGVLERSTVGAKTVGGVYPPEWRSTTTASRVHTDTNIDTQNTFGVGNSMLCAWGSTVPSVIVTGVFIGNCSPTPFVITHFYPSMAIFSTYSRGIQ
jgi:hypothetical protein